jgi:hypothetical protein
LAIIEISCPRCGSTASKTKNPCEYQCTHCGTKFRFTRPQDATITYDVQSHICTVCGTPITQGHVYRCIECGQSDVCSNCVRMTVKDAVKGAIREPRYMCIRCLQSKKLNCTASGCFDVALYLCVNCGKRSCAEHLANHFSRLAYSLGAYTRFVCENCGGDVCDDCVDERRGFFSKKFFCKRCGSELTLMP